MDSLFWLFKQLVGVALALLGIGLVVGLLYAMYGAVGGIRERFREWSRERDPRYRHLKLQAEREALGYREPLPPLPEPTPEERFGSEYAKKRKELGYDD